MIGSHRLIKHNYVKIIYGTIAGYISADTYKTIYHQTYKSLPTKTPENKPLKHALTTAFTIPTIPPLLLFGPPVLAVKKVMPYVSS